MEQGDTLERGNQKALSENKTEEKTIETKIGKKCVVGCLRGCLLLGADGPVCRKQGEGWCLEGFSTQF